MARALPDIDTIDDFSGERVLVRVDFNVPLKNGAVADDYRLRASVPTLRALLERGARQLILLSHLGRPKGKKVGELSLMPVAPCLSGLLDEEVAFVDWLEHAPEQIEKSLETSGARICLLENVRFHPGEEKGDKQLARLWASLGSVYVNDAFGAAHRPHTSVYHLPQLFAAGRRAAGLLMKREVNYALQLLEEPRRPFVVIVGGAKISDKIGLLERLCELADHVLIGGAMAFPFIKAGGGVVGASYCEEEAIPLAMTLLEKWKDKIHLPEDVVVVSEEESTPKRVPATKIPAGWRGGDVGPATIEKWSSVVLSAGTIFWNGPLGKVEDARFAEGTRQLIHLLEQATRRGAVTVAGGGDTASAIRSLKSNARLSHISTGGGALLELLEKGTLPAIEALCGRTNTETKDPD